MPLPSYTSGFDLQFAGSTVTQTIVDQNIPATIKTPMLR
jgi:hypothetical protein